MLAGSDVVENDNKSSASFAADPPAIAETACRLAVEKLDASRAQFTAVEGVPGAEIGEVRGEYVRVGVPMPRRFAFATYGENLVSSMRDGKTLILTNTDTDPRLTVELRHAFRAVESPAAIAVPLVKNGLLITTLTLHDSVKRAWTRHEVAIVQETAERTWAAIERAQAVAALAASEAALRESDARQAFLLKLSDALRPISDATAIQDVATRLLGEQLQVDRAYYNDIHEDGDQATLREGYRDGVASNAGQARISDFDDYVGAELRDGRIAVFNDVTGDARTTAAQKDVYAANSIAAWLGVPLVKAGRLVALLGITQSRPREWTKAEIALTADVAERTWAAVERAHAEAALRATEERQRLTVELVPALLWSAGPDGREVTLNEKWLAYTGKKEAATQDYGWLNSIHPDDLPAARTDFEQAFTTGQPLERQHRICKVGHGYRWHLVRQVPVRDERGDIMRWFGAAVDIHDGKLAEAALRASEERFAQFAKASSAGLWIRDAETLAMEFVSPAIATIYGVETDAFLGDMQNWAAMIVPEDREAALEHVAQARGGTSVVHEFRIQRPSDRTFRWIRNTDFPLGGNGHPQRVGGIAEDVTEQKLAVENQGVLLLELQHRVRNIMALIRSITARTGERAASVQDYTEQMLGRLMAFARVQALLTRAANLSVGISSIVHDEVSVQAQHEGQYVIAGPDIELSPKAAEILTLAVHELATNAVKYGALSAPDGKVSVTWSPFEKRGETWLAFEWIETGAPQRPATDGPKRRGFGSDLIEGRVPYELKGRGTIAIEPGGARCHLEFPLQGGASILETGAPQRGTVFGGVLDMTGEADLSGHRVLVVEDDYYLATDAARALQSAGAQVMGPCGSEEDARAEMDEQRPDAVILDINLGQGATFKLAEHLKDRSIPFVFTTGYDQVVIPADFVGVERLEKPFHLRRVVDAAARLVGAAYNCTTRCGVSRR